jgi:UDP-2,3-diacylglucosamine pyrophosphatase LpxH
MQTTEQKEDKLYIIYDASDFLEAAAQKKREAHAPKEAMQKLQSILKKTDEESNPILLIVTLK